MSEIERLNAAIESAPRVALRELIEQVSIRAGFQVNDVAGVDINKEFIVSRANLTDSDTSKYKVVPKNHFACNLMHIGRDIKIPVALNHSGNDLYVSPAYYVFHVKNSKLLSQYYLYIELNRFEFDRLTWFNTDSSVRGNLKEDRFLDIRIPLPPIEVQQRYVDAYVGMQKLAEENEALLEPLSKACQACLSDARKKYTAVQLADYIEAVDNRNSNGGYSVDHLQGVTSAGVFDYSKAKTDGIDFTKYKVVKEGYFAYNPSRINLGSIALRKGMDCIISPMYIVFKVNTKGQDELLPEFLYLWFMRPEFQRSTLFYASGSVRDTFGYNEMCRVNIPLPPIEVQQSIVALHRCAEEARSIASKAREALNTICPAMIQRASHEMH